MPKGIPLTEVDQSRKRVEIFNAAVHLFLEKGFNETSMREIAGAAGVGKSTLYDYFPTKDEILVSMVEERLKELTLQVKEIANQPDSPVVRLRRIILSYLDYLADNENFFLHLSIEVQRLGQNSQARIMKSRHEYQDAIRDVIDSGIKEGCFRQVDSLLASRLILSAFSAAVFANRKASSREQMINDAFTLLLNGLQA
ncbi:MAG: TetR/AcrR family transcriptional regulator [Anaerolineaceae bacterium]